MPIHSRLYTSEVQRNVAHQGGEAELYYPLWVRREGRWQFALLTRAQLDVALARGTAQPEDRRPRAPGGLAERLLRALGWK